MSQDLCARCGITPAVVGNAGGGVCLDCIRAAGPSADPLLSIRKSRLEAALRGLVNRVGEVGFTQKRVNEEVARAMEELSHE